MEGKEVGEKRRRTMKDSQQEARAKSNDEEVDMETEESVESVLVKLGVSQADWEAAIRVGTALGRAPDMYDTKAMRPLRKSWGQLVAAKAKECFNKTARVPDLGRKERLRRQKEYDQKIMGTRRLRAMRMKQLEALMENPNSSLAQIPDGAVDDGVNTSFGQAGGVESVPQVLQDKGGVIEDGGKVYINTAQSCYICKGRFLELHHFYDKLCPSCAALSWEKRVQKCDMKNKVVLLTGGRVKIGFHTALKCLRMGATVHVTTRFVADAALRFGKEADFEEWKDNLTIHGLDFRDIRAVEQFASFLATTLPRLDVIINNACQTIRRPAAYYRHLVEGEKKLFVGDAGDSKPAFEQAKSVIDPHLWHHGGVSAPHLVQDKQEKQDGEVAFATLGTAALATSSSSSSSLSSTAGKALSASELSQVSMDKYFGDKSLEFSAEETEKLFPAQFDVNGTQLDLRTTNSWVLTLSKVSTPEIIEVLSVNTVAPTVLNARLKELMVRTKEQDEKNGLQDVGRYIINVSAMEGKFYRFKNANHPHTNMAKAALNMMTRTAAEEYAQDGIYMNSVDTGWINDENPIPTAQRIFTQNSFQTPIDEVDAASRLLDPVVSGMNGGERVYGKFLKDYHSTEW